MLSRLAQSVMHLEVLKSPGYTGGQEWCRKPCDALHVPPFLIVRAWSQWVLNLRCKSLWWAANWF